MRSIRKTNTKPELAVRRAAHAMGLRFRLHRRDLPGSPDLVFPRLRKAIFVHGCFWHQHGSCRAGRLPKNRLDYWGPKLARNVARDAEAEATLIALGWDVLTLWECELADKPRLLGKLEAFLRPPSGPVPELRPESPSLSPGGPRGHP